MKPSTLLFTAAISALLAVSATAWPFFHPPHFPFFPPHFPFFPPHFPPRPFFPFPPGGGSAPPPSSDSPSSADSGSGSGFPPAGDVKKCLKVLHHSGLESCFHHKYDAEKCCTYLSGLEDSCTYVPFYKSPFFRGILKHVCDAASAPPPTS